MARVLLTVVPTVVTAASALAFWLCQAGGKDAEDNEPQAPTGFVLLPPSASLATDTPDELSVVSWNVLADVFASQQAKLDYVPQEQLDWAAHRWPLIKKQLTGWQADLVLLQEVDVVW